MQFCFYGLFILKHDIYENYFSFKEKQFAYPPTDNSLKIKPANYSIIFLDFCNTIMLAIIQRKNVFFISRGYISVISFSQYSDMKLFYLNTYQKANNSS